MIRSVIAAFAALLSANAVAFEVNRPDDHSVFPPLHAQRFFIETDASSGGIATSGDSGGWIRSAFGTGAAFQGVTTAVLNSATGLMQIDLGTLVTNFVDLRSHAQTFNFANGTAKFIAVIREGVASTAGETYIGRVGFLDSTTAAESTDACYFRYTHGVNSGRWQIVARSNNSEAGSVQDSGITFTATTDRLFGITATTSSCAFFVNGVQVGTTISTNVPTGNARTLGCGIMFMKTVGTTNVVPLYLDYMACQQVPATPRAWTF